MTACARCSADVPTLYAVTTWDDQAHERYLYSQVLDADLLWINFPGRDVALTVCRVCYVVLTGNSPPASTGPSSGRSLFSMRSLQSGLATALARALFEQCGYEVRQTGYEYSMPEWVSKMKGGDPNPAVARVRVIPDLHVYDKKLNSLYQVEIKTTRQRPSAWLCRKDNVDTIQYHHPDTILMIYVQQLHRFFVQHVSAIDWNGITIKVQGNESFYQVDFGTLFKEPPMLFRRITAQAYEEFLRDSETTLRDFAA